MRGPMRLRELAERLGLELRGPDLEIVTFGALNTRSPNTDRMLTWIVDPALAPELDRVGIAACVVGERDAETLGDHSLLITDHDPAEVFYSIFLDAARDAEWEQLGSGRGTGVEIASTAVVHEGVQLGDDCVIMDHAVILPNSRLGDRVTVKPNATVGGDGFLATMVDGRQTMVPHMGGVWIGDDVQIGSQTCVDRGMFGGFTEIGSETRIDNLVHVGHSAALGERGLVAACAEIGTIVAEEGFWLGPQTCALQGLILGRYSYAGIGSVLVRDIPDHGLVYGSPAKQQGWMCVCRTKLEPSGGKATCRRCRREYTERDDGLTEVAPVSAG